MSFTYRSKPKLSDRLRGKSSEEILDEMQDVLDNGSKLLFESPWNFHSRFPRGFPFHEIPRTSKVRSNFGNRYADCPEDFKEPWPEDFMNEVFPEREANSYRSKKNPTREPDCGPSTGDSGCNSKLNQFGLRNTVPLGRNPSPEEQRRTRSMSAPPDNRATDKKKRFVSKCQIPMMQDPEEQGMPSHEPKPGNSANVRIIPIQVEGRDEPVINADIDTSGNFSSEKVPFEARLPRDFGSYQRHSPRFAHKERVPSPQQQQQQYQQPHPQQYQQPHPQQYQQPHSQQYQQPHSQQQKRQQPQAESMPIPMPMPMPPPPQQQPQQPQGPPETDEVDSKQAEAAKAPEPPKDPLTKVGQIQKEVDELKQQIEAFDGNSRSDKQFMMLDEMLTRKLISLDDINTEGKEDVRQARKDTIRSIQRCISMLESRVPAVENKDSNESNEEVTALVPVGPKDMDTIREPNGETSTTEKKQATGEVVKG